MASLLRWQVPDGTPVGEVSGTTRSSWCLLNVIFLPFDVTDPANPVDLPFITPGSMQYGIALRDNFLYCHGTIDAVDHLFIMAVYDPTSPVLFSSTPVDWASQMELDGGLAFLTSSSGVIHDDKDSMADALRTDWSPTFQAMPDCFRQHLALEELKPVVQNASETWSKIRPPDTDKFYKSVVGAKLAPVKKALSLMGKISDEVKLPLCGMSDANITKFKAILTQYNLI